LQVKRPLANERVLVVDDEKGVVRSCVRILQREGFVVTGLTDSLQVPELLRQETFDLLLTDIKMPKMDGLQLLRIAKEIDPHLSVVLITGYGTMEDAIEAIQLGAQGFLMKPFEPQDLIATIKDNLSRRALIRDSLRLQTLLPLLEINHILQVSGGEISLVRRVLEIAQKATGATRLAWLSRQSSDRRSDLKLIEAAVFPQPEQNSQLPAQVIQQVMETARPIWMLADGALIEALAGQPNIVGAALPLLIKGEVVGLLTAETGGQPHSGPFGQIGLELLSVLAGQLAIIIENVSLFQQAELLRTFNEDIIENMTNGLIAVDQDGVVTAFNPAASVMLGHPVSQVLHQPLTQLARQAGELVAVFEQALASHKAQPYQEITLKRESGQALSVSVRTAPLKGKNGHPQPVGVVGVIEDLSEIKAMEAERRRLDRLAALGEMAAVVAHEIRNPVAGIAAGIDYLTRNAREGSVEFEGAAMMKGEIRRITRILEDILFVARPLQLNLSPELIPPLIEGVIRRCQPQAEAGKVVMLFNYEDGLPALQVDSQRLEQVFTNLIINAIQAMPEGGQVVLQADVQRNSKAANMVITVSDNGPGIRQDIRQQIFEPFFTTKSKGTGLGLSIARRIIEEHGGMITVSSREKQGTCFTIQLPIEKRIIG
jgi:PAS domain S-box-containing protein